VTRQRIELGRLGEDLAADLLIRKGWEVLARNVALSQGELDLIARDGDTLVFVEVKTLRTRTDGHGSAPEYAVLAVDGRKRSRIRRLAAEWLSQGCTPTGIAEFRFDVVGVEFDRDPPNGRPRLDHIEHAF
jgi:putative endonuclease